MQLKSMHESRVWQRASLAQALKLQHLKMHFRSLLHAYCLCNERHYVNRLQRCAAGSAFGCERRSVYFLHQ